MRAKWTCRGHCGASCGLYDLAEPHHNAKTRVHLRFFNGLLEHSPQPAAIREVLPGRLPCRPRLSTARLPERRPSPRPSERTMPASSASADCDKFLYGRWPKRGGRCRRRLLEPLHRRATCASTRLGCSSRRRLLSLSWVCLQLRVPGPGGRGCRRHKLARPSRCRPAPEIIPMSRPRRCATWRRVSKRASSTGRRRCSRCADRRAGAKAGEAPAPSAGHFQCADSGAAPPRRRVPTDDGAGST